jgi:hypothetical protein
MSDGQRLVITGASPASASTAVIGAVGGLQIYDSLQIIATIQGATGGTLDLYLQSSVDGTSWYDYVHFAQFAAAAAALTRFISVSRHGQVTTLTAIGSGTSPALAVNTVLGGDFGTRLRLLAVAGASTSAGAAQAIVINGTRLR